MMAPKKGGRRCRQTSAPGAGIDKDSAAGCGDNRLYAVIVTPLRAFVNPLVGLLCNILQGGRLWAP